jgi:acetyl-CoA C-acetyltransferase
MLMGETAEVLAEQYKISREEQDQFALTSQQRAAVGASERTLRCRDCPRHD